MCISQKVNSIIEQNLGHIKFYLKTKITVDFHICPNVRLIDRRIVMKSTALVF